MTAYRTPAAASTCEQVIRNSRFVCSIGHADSKALALEAIGRIRREHPQASHVCWAYIAGGPDSPERGLGDDGEPHGTAGRPMLSLLEHAGLGEVWTTVTRYFGGIKLGTGGLVRAYGSTLQRALAGLETITSEPMHPCRLGFGYPLLPIIEMALQEERAEIVSRRFSERVELTVNLPAARIDRIGGRLADLSGGTLTIERG